MVRDDIQTLNKGSSDLCAHLLYLHLHQSHPHVSCTPNYVTELTLELSKQNIVSKEIVTSKLNYRQYYGND